MSMPRSLSSCLALAIANDGGDLLDMARILTLIPGLHTYDPTTQQTVGAER